MSPLVTFDRSASCEGSRKRSLRLRLKLTTFADSLTTPARERYGGWKKQLDIL